VVVDDVKAGTGDRGYDAKALKMVSMYDAGIIDPTKVVRCALQNAASIAGLMLTTETLVTDLKDEKKPALGAST
jgi:chaperonin GroEL